MKNNYLKILESNKRSANGFRYTIPSSSVYPHQWLWDSCFHAIIYTIFDDTEYAMDEIKSLLKGQWDNGMIPHMIYWRESSKHKVKWGTDKNTSSITQPPMIAYAVERIYFKNKDENFVKEVFDNLDRYYKWLHDDRAEDYLLAVLHPWETGADDFVPWDNVYDVKNPSKEILMKHKHNILNEYINSNLDSKEFLKKDIFNVKGLLFNSIYLRNLESMLFLSELIKSDEADYYRDIIQKVKESFIQNFYNNKTDLYSSFYNEHKFVDDFDNIELFLPLFAGVLTKEQASELVDKYLLNKNKFWTDYPVPTISLENKNFQPERYWRGSTWINVNWFIYQGLIRYGFNEVADNLSAKTQAIIEKSGFCEYFNSINGDGLGPKDFTWSGLVFDM